jgi:thiol-disulfide isomerase/thioredoxin
MSILTLATFITALAVGNGSADSLEKSYVAARSESMSTGKPLVVLVSGDHCPHCVTMKNSTIPALAKEGALKGMEYSVVDSSRDSTADALMRGGFIPQLVIFVHTENGWKKDVLVGAQSADKVESFLKANAAKSVALKDRTDKKMAEKPAATNGNNSAAAKGATSPQG